MQPSLAVLRRDRGSPDRDGSGRLHWACERLVMAPFPRAPPKPSVAGRWGLSLAVEACPPALAANEVHATIVAPPPPWPVRFGPALALTLLLGLVVALVPPRYEAAQNDDFAYVAAVQQWLATGTLPDLAWNDPTLVFQLAWGALFALPFGASYTTLRVSTIVLAWLGALAFMALLRRCGARPAAAFVGGGVLLLHPLVIVATWSFNSDVPYVALATIATHAVVVACDRRSLRWMALAGLCVAAAFLVRQVGAIVAVVGAFWIARRPGVERRWIIAALVAWLTPIVIAAEWHASWLRTLRGGGWWPMFAVVGESSWTRWLAFVPVDAFATFTNGVVVAAPFAVAALLGRRDGVAGGAPPARRAFFVALALVAALSIASAFGQPEGERGWPYGGSYLTRRGPAFDLVGLVATTGSPLFWWAATLAVPLVAAWWCGALRRAVAVARTDASPSGPVTLLLVAGAAQLAPAFLVSSFYDRYVLVALPAFATVAALALPTSRRATIALGAVFVVVAALSVEWLRAYVDRATARWEVCETLVERGVPVGSIRGGLSWEGHHLYLEARAQLGLRQPWRDWAHGPPWAGLQSIQHVLVEAPTSPRKALATRSYRPFLATRPLQVSAVELRARAKGGGS